MEGAVNAAIGAGPKRVTGMVLAEGSVLAGLGAVVGRAGALALGRAFGGLMAIAFR